MAPAFALSDADIDGDSLISFNEKAANYSYPSEEASAAVDMSDDSLVDETELAAAVETGMIKDLAEYTLRKGVNQHPIVTPYWSASLGVDGSEKQN